MMDHEPLGYCEKTLLLLLLLSLLLSSSSADIGRGGSVWEIVGVEG
jgi:hypothetical protein